MIKNNLTYEPPMKEIQVELDILTLLNDVRVDFHRLNYPIVKSSLKGFLKIIESGECNIEEEKAPFNYSVDLSKAQSLIQDYRRKSEGGCQSCKKFKIFKPFSDETLKYCDFSENQKIALDNFNNMSSLSPRLQKFYNSGCEEKRPIFNKTIEELLEIK
jgi:hypothetical protein